MRDFSFHSIRTCAAILFALLAVVSVWPQSSGACEITVMKSADLKPYRDVIRGIRDAHVCNIRERELDDFDGPDFVIAERTTAVIAVGTAAFRKVRVIANLPVLYVMVMPSEVDRFPGSNISGVGMDAAPGEYLSAMRRAIPDAKRIGVLYDPSYTGKFVDEAITAARDSGMELLVRQVRGTAGVPAALHSLAGRADILWMLPDPSVSTAESVDFLLRYSISQNVPIFTFSRKYVEMGAVASLDVDPYDMGLQVAALAKRLIDSGGEPIHVPARKTRLTINEKTAAKMGIKLGERKADGF